MITRLSHACVFVLDQDEAKDFYVNKLGFEVRIDAPMGEGGRWLGVGPKGQPDCQITLILPELTNGGDNEVSRQIRELVAKGALANGVLESSDIHKDYEELLAKGVTFKGPPKEEFYGTEAIMVDPSGNWYSLTERKM
jgi:catechol 2,3-dioxygenase-like lactoylglutathione lyase family enzyme